MTDDVFLGIDAGTSTIKTVAFDERGRERHRSARPTSICAPRSGWQEVSMAEVWELSAETVAETVAALDDARVVALGVTGQGDGCWLLDDDGEPVRDAILWSDSRAAGVVEKWAADGTEDRIAATCGSLLFPGSSLPLLRWLADEEPGAVDRAATLVSCKDWIAYRLTGELTTDPSDASLPYLDVEAVAYAPAVFEAAGVGDPDLLPRLVAPGTVLGSVRDHVADRLGLPEGVPVVAGMIDVAASALGSGVVAPGESASVVGTTSLNQTLTADPPAATSGITLALGSIDGERRWSNAMASMAGTTNVDWAREHLTDGADFDRLEAAVESVPAGSEGVLYLPFLSAAGERAPFRKTTARAGFVGLEPGHTRAHLLRAVYEGVALAMRDCFAHGPADVDRVHLAGGGAASAAWCQLFADCLDARIVVPEGSEFGAKGVALLAATALDRFPDVATAVAETTTVARSYRSSGDREAYDRLYDLYATTCEAMFDVWDAHRRTYDAIG